MTIVFSYVADILTMKSVKGNTGNAQRHPRIALDRLPQNEADYEAFVLQFPIDDSISECFALTSDAERKSTSPKFITVCIYVFSNLVIC